MFLARAIFDDMLHQDIIDEVVLSQITSLSYFSIRIVTDGC